MLSANMKVDRSRIIDEALALLNEVGVDALSTRLLAQRLGVQQPALYWHFRNKRALLDAMNGEILARGHLHQIPRAGEDWRGFFLANAHSFRAALLAYRDGARVHAGTEAQPEEVGQHEQQLRIFVDAGFPVGEAMALLVAVGRYTVGCVLEEQTQALQGSEPQAVLDAAAEAYPLMAEAMSYYRRSTHATLFEAGLILMADGAAARLG